MLNADGRSCDGKCEDICYNTAGSYRCLCSEGYVLNADGRSCDGKCEDIATTEPVPTDVCARRGMC